MSKKKLSDYMFVKLYLTLYNIVQLVGWSMIVYQVALHYASSSAHCCSKRRQIRLWDNTNQLLTVFQTLQSIEVLHATLKLVPSSPFITLLQTGARSFVVWAILLPYQDTRLTVGLPFILFAWPIGDVIRYSYYILNTFNAVPYLLTWCRYSAFIILYWFGVFGELILMYNALPYIRKRQTLYYKLPNPYNISFYLDYFLIMVMTLYTPFFLKTYNHMLLQRKKVLNKTVKEKAN